MCFNIIEIKLYNFALCDCLHIVLYESFFLNNSLDEGSSTYFWIVSGCSKRIFNINFRFDFFFRIFRSEIPVRLSMLKVLKSCCYFIFGRVVPLAV